MSKIEIILTPGPRSEALRKRRQAGEQLLADEFKGPTFLDAKYKFNAMGFEVHVDGNIYVYPDHSIARIKISPNEVAA